MAQPLFSRYWATQCRSEAERHTAPDLRLLTVQVKGRSFQGKNSLTGVGFRRSTEYGMINYMGTSRMTSQRR